MKKLLLVFSLILAVTAMVQAQEVPTVTEHLLTSEPTPPPPPPQNETFAYVEQMPEFPGGQQALMEYLSKNIKYPAKAIKEGIQGRVIVRFVINRTGTVERAEVIRGLGSGCDEEALRVVNAMPKWKPGKHNGQAVSTFYTWPIIFKLDDNDTPTQKK